MKNIYLLKHKHKHGTDVYLFQSEIGFFDLPDEGIIAEKLEIDYDFLSESINISRVEDIDEI